uniref:Uncharacterized protein n=1 Tax=Kalanchoe fedtschenkoi TaxID=63787 RepID=A0A7N0TPB0_KALFE
MHAYNRLPSSGHSTTSPPNSPISRSPRYRKSKQARSFPSGRQTLAQRRRRWQLLLRPGD